MIHTSVAWCRYPAQLHRTLLAHAMLLIGTRTCMYTRIHPHALIEHPGAGMPVSTTLSRHSGPSIAVDIPPPPIQAPPATVVPPGAEQIALQVEPHESLLPSGRRLQVAAMDLPGLRIEIAQQLGLQDLRLQVRSTCTTDQIMFVRSACAALPSSTAPYNSIVVECLTIE